MTTTLPATVQLSTLTKEIGAHIEALSAPTAENIAVGLKYLLDGGMAWPQTIKAKDAIEVYAKTLASVPACGFRTVLSKLRHGHYENINLAFIPLPNELAAMSRAEAKSTRDNLARLRETIATLESLKRPEKEDAASRARVLAMLGKFRAGTAARKVASDIPQERMSDEKAEDFRKIMAMGDAPNVSAEQAAFRRKIASEINNADDDMREAAE